MNVVARVPHFAGTEKGFLIREFPLPEVEADGIMIQLTASSICGTDIHMWKGEMPTRAGGFIGHEMTGAISQLGKNVSSDSQGQALHEGDRVVFAFSNPCGHCPYCAGGDYFACPNRGQTVTDQKYLPFLAAFGEYRYLPPGSWVYKVPNALTDEVVAPINCAASTVLHALGRARLEHGETVVVQGAGGLGLYAIPFAKEATGGMVIAIDTFNSRLKLARRMGADETVSFEEWTSPEDRIRRVKELCGGWGADVVIDCVGTVAGMQEGLAMTGPAGRYLEVGNTIPTNEISLRLSSFVNARIVLFLTGGYNPSDLEQVMSFIEQTTSKYPYADLIDEKYPMDRINEAFAAADWKGLDQTKARVGRILVTPQ